MQYMMIATHSSIDHVKCDLMLENIHLNLEVASWIDRFRASVTMAIGSVPFLAKKNNEQFRC